MGGKIADRASRMKFSDLARQYRITERLERAFDPEAKRFEPMRYIQSIRPPSTFA